MLFRLKAHFLAGLIISWLLFLETCNRMTMGEQHDGNLARHEAKSTSYKIETENQMLFCAFYRHVSQRWTTPIWVIRNWYSIDTNASNPALTMDAR